MRFYDDNIDWYDVIMTPTQVSLDEKSYKDAQAEAKRQGDLFRGVLSTCPS